jgi:hypothetical protein
MLRVIARNLASVLNVENKGDESAKLIEFFWIVG